MNAQEKRAQRQQEVLRIIVRLYIGTARPVSSDVVAHALKVSSATVRNVMAELEEMGYLSHPHTSAGRIPTDQGYRFYVDSLMELRDMAEDVSGRLQSECARTRTFQQLVTTSVDILTQLTSFAGFALIPAPDEIEFKHIELVPLKGEKILVVLVSTLGEAKTCVISLAAEVDPRYLARVEEFLNDQLPRQNLSGLKHRLEDLLSQQRSSFYAVVKDALDIMNRAVFYGCEDRVFLEGTRRLLKQPDFHDVDQIHQILSFLEEKQRLLDVIEEDLSGVAEMRVRIGSEHKRQDIESLSIISAKYHVNDQLVGAIGIIGPTRMEYDLIIPTVRSLAEIINQTLRG